MGRQLADRFARAARRQGFPARSVFKLEALDERFRLFSRTGARVLDLGAAPGSWSLLAASRGARVTAVDLHGLGRGVVGRLPADARVFKRDVRDWLSEDCAPGTRFDVVLSDMAPSTTGIKTLDAAASLELCELALAVARRVLAPTGAFVVKMFQGGSTPQYRKQVEGCFRKVHVVRPPASMRSRTELFIVGLGFDDRNRVSEGDEEEEGGQEDEGQEEGLVK